MLKPEQKISLAIASAGLAAISGTVAVILKNSFEIENKAVALGQVLLAHENVLTDEDLKHLAQTGINLTK